MATNILTAQQLTCNDDLRLAHIFVKAFQHFCDFKAPLVQVYCKELSTILCLGFAAALLVEDTYITKYKHHLNVHLQYCDLVNHSVALSILQKSGAEMIKLGLNLFRSKNTAEYNDALALLFLAGQKGVNIASFLFGGYEDKNR